MSDEINFLPFLRRGLAQSITGRDPLTGPLPREPELTAWVEVEGQRVKQTIRLRSADAAVGIGVAQVVRSEPQPDSNDVEANYFPFVELAAPDLPWLLTPAAADTQDRLRPWLVLVVVREQQGVSIETRSTAPLPVLRIENPAVPNNELPDLADSWAWAHVQSLISLDAIDTAVATNATDVIARLVCPRRLLPRNRYVACVVPAFEGGRLRGLGQDPPDTDLAPAWDLASVGETIELPVYHQWGFATGASGDFESLCRRLQPDEIGATMGLHALDISDPGLVTPAGETVLLDMEGALKTVDAHGRAWPVQHKETFQTEIVALLDAGIARGAVTPPPPGTAYDPTTQDPVVAPPAYGSWPAGVGSLPSKGWLATLNLNPVHRAAAGLGARVVTTIQESVVAAAWEQAGSLRATIVALNRGRLAAEVGRSLAARAVAMGDADLLQVTARLHALLPGGSESISTQLAASSIPAGLVSAAYSRHTRPGTALSRDWAKRTGRPSARLAADHVQTMLAATQHGAKPALTQALEFAAFGVPAGAQTSDPTLEATFSWETIGSTDAVRTAQIEEILQNRLGLHRLSAERLSPPLPPPASTPTVPAPTPAKTGDVSNIASVVRRRLDAPAAVRANVVTRIPALDTLLASGSVPTWVAVSPQFDDPLFWDLLGLGASWILPGVQLLGSNRVRLVAVNWSFVGAFLIGANHRMAQELLWRGYPVDMRATFFHRFWDYVGDSGASRDDISDLSSWTLDQTILENLDRTQEAMTAIVVRGDLVRRYPTAHWFLQQAELDSQGHWIPVDGNHVEVSFLGALDPRTVVLGFDLPPKIVRGDRANGVPGYFVAVEEQPGGPRMGLDVEKPADFVQTPTSWDELSWGHLVANQEELDALTHARATGTRIDGLVLGADGTTWGRNAAHMASAVWQRPFRMLIHADTLI